MKHFLFLVSVCLSILLYASEANCAVIYVDIDANGANNGNSWTNAFEDLHDALAAAGPNDELWVAEGTYKPHSTNRLVFFHLTNGVEMYGGFGGFETARAQRNWELYPTIISGAIGTSAETDNSYILVRVDGDNTLIDGFDFRRAYNEGPTYGAALLVFGENFQLKHCSIHNNTGLNKTAINVSYDTGVPIISECLFYDNESTGSTIFGTGLTFSRMIFVNCTITRNTTNSGFIFDSISGTTIELENCIIWNHDDALFSPFISVEARNCIIENLDEVPFVISENIISENPDFTAPGSDDFTFEFSSPARNSGSNSLSVSNRDLNGNTRIFDGTVDIGAYEIQAAAIIYVDINATGLNNGASWLDAYTDLQDALNIAQAGQQIWVAEGIYKTSSTNNRLESFVLKNNVPVYGGFNGTETTLEQRDWFTNITNLSGNIGNIASTADNAYHVIFADDEFGSFYIDGFSIFGGNANGLLVHEDIGAAALIEFSEGTFTIANCFVFNNFADYTGGAVSTFANSVFLNTSFVNNEAHIGGAISWTNGTLIENCLFVDNTANIGIVSHNTLGTLDMRGCTFEGNTVAWDVNSIVSGGNGTVANTIIWGNTLFDANEKAITSGTEVHHCILQGGELSSIDEGVEVYYEDPLFINPAGLNYGLSGESVGANGGDNSLVTTVYDIVGNERIRLGTVDMGAVEGVSAVPGIIYVDDNAGGANDGSSWIDAYTDFQSALTASTVGDEIWVAGGWYRTTSTTNRDIRFEMKDSLQIYGGFAGIETDRNARDWSINKSQLTGDIGSETNTDNTKRLLNLDNDQGVLIDGFVLRGTYDDPNISLFGATAIYAINNSTLTLRHCEVFDNTSYNGSGAVVSSNCVSIFDNCLFHDNLINSGGIINTGSSSAYIKIFSCTIAGNHMIQTFAKPLGGNSDAQYDIYNSIIWDNENIQNNISGDVDITNCIIEGYVQDNNDTLFTPMISIDPLFVSPNTGDPDYTLLPSSIAVNTGSNVNSILVYDLNHNLRIQNGTIDIGAYEQNSCGQTNDDCLGTTTLTLDADPVMGSTKCATGGDSPANACAGTSGKTVWFSFVAPSSGEVIINANQLLAVTSNFNLRLSLYSGSCATLTYVTCINASGIGENEVLNASGLTPGATYYVRIDAPSSQEGVFMIDVDAVASDCPGDFDNSGTVGVGDLLIFNGAFGCTSACGEEDMDNSGEVNVTDLLLFIAQFGVSCE
jgi:hypothetical protein